MRRAQFDKPIFFILALVVVALVLYVGYLGIDFLVKVQQDREMRAFWNGVDRLVSRNMNSGAMETITLTLPRSNAICFFNVSATDKICEIYTIPGDSLSGNNLGEMTDARSDICEDYKAYWELTSDTSESDNIILSSGVTHRNVRIQPSNGVYQCFEGNTFRVKIEGRGRHVEISPT